MTALVIFIVAAAIVAGYVIYRVKKGHTIPEVVIPPPVHSPGSNGGEVTGFEYVGEANPSAPSGEFACANPIDTRSYYTRNIIQVGETLYNGLNPLSPTNGGGYWIALTDLGGDVHVVKVEVDGRISKLFAC